MNNPFKDITITDCITTVAIVVGLCMLIASFVVGITNANNRITEGTVIDKQYHAAYTTISHSGSGKHRRSIPHHHPERYIFTIEGDKDGRTVQYTFDVTAAQYERYSIGDYFKM